MSPPGRLMWKHLRKARSAVVCAFRVAVVGCLFFLLASQSFGAGSMGEVYVSVTCSPDPLPSGWKWQLSYQDVNGSWYTSAQGGESDTIFKQDPYWINRSIRWRCQLLKDYSPYGSPQEKINLAGADSISFFVSVPQPPSAPSGVSASDGQYADRVIVSWNGLSGATVYEVWRNTVGTSSTASKLGETGSTSYSDTTGSAGVTYYYWIKTRGTSGTSGFSSSDSGYVSANPPSAPTGVSASDGTYANQVQISWSVVSGATGYEVWRNTASEAASAQRVGESTSASYSDTSAAGGTVYYYWVKARNSGGGSVFSAGDSGYLLVLPPSPPTGVSASDGTWSNNVQVSWLPVAGATGYEVWRNALVDTNTAIKIGTTTGLSLDDAVSVGVTNVYWIKASNSAGISGFSAPDGGFASSSASGWIAAPTGVHASDGTYSNKIAVTWNVVAGATTYEVWRNVANNLATAIKTGESAVTTYDDASVSQGATYYYWLKSKNAASLSGFSSPDSGYMARAYDLPSSVSAGEFFIDADPGAGNGTPLAAKDFFYNSQIEDGLQGVVDESLFSVGSHRVGVRFRKNGVWGNPVYTHIYVYEDAEPAIVAKTMLNDAEYFVDSDYGYGQMLPLFADDGTFNSGVEGVTPPSIRTSSLDPGAHQIGTRFRKSDGEWSEIVYSTFCVYEDSIVASAPTSTIVEAEYFWDEPPRGGAGLPLAWSNIPPLQGLAIAGQTNISTAPMQPGRHKLGSRFKDSEGFWGNPLWHLVDVVPEDTPFSNANLHVESNIGVPTYNLDSVQRKGDLISLRVPATIEFVGKTYFNMGWIGTGDCPANGDSNQVGFVINHDSTLTWIWSDRRFITLSISNDFSLGVGAGTYLRYSAVTASVPEYVYAGTNVRWRLTNYLGSGSVPASSGVPTQVVFMASENSSIIYQWVKQYRVHTPAENGRVYNNWNWYDQGTATELYPAPDRSYVFRSWMEDGVGTNVPGVFEVNDPKTIKSLFRPQFTSNATLTVHEIDGSFTSYVYAVSSRVTLGPRVDVNQQGELRDVVNGWRTKGALDAAGDGTNLTLVVTGDVDAYWGALRQYHLVPRIIPSAGGSVRITAHQTRPDTNWYDAGVFRAVATPASGYRFAGWYLKAWKEPVVEAVLDDRVKLVAFFRREKPLAGFVEVRGGSLTSPNTSAYTFTNILDTFRLQQREVTTEQYAKYLNECLENNTIAYPNRLSVRGQNPVSDYMTGVRVEYFAGDNIAAEPLFRNRAADLTFNFTNGSPASAKYGTPLATVSLTDDFSMRFMGEIYVPSNGTVNFRELSDNAVALYIDGIIRVNDTNPTYNATASLSLTQGWHAFEVAYLEYSGLASMQIQWDLSGGNNFTNIPSSSLRCLTIPDDYTNIVAASGSFSFYPDQELYDLDAPNANIELVSGIYQPKADAANQPVVEVSWYGADAYCRWLAECTGEPIDLPNEWMWEYAASAGNSTVAGNYFPWGPKFGGANHNQANYLGQGGIDVYDKTAPVGLFSLYNTLYDMAGNVWEWTSSRQNEGSEWRVIRGGSFNQIADPYLGTSYRLAYKSQDYGDESIGFRPAVIYTAHDFRQAGYVMVTTSPPLSTPNSSFGGYEEPHAPFQLKAIEICNAEYAEFLNAAMSNGWTRIGGQDISGAVPGWFDGVLWVRLGSDSGMVYTGGVFAARIGCEDLPIVQVSWYGASAFAQWQNQQHSDTKMEVPAEWQWEKAMARGSLVSIPDEESLLPSGRVGLNVAYDYSMWPGFYDASGNAQEWTESMPDSALSDYAVLRGGAFNLLPRSFSYRADYAEKSEARFYFGIRPAITHVCPQFGWKQESLLLTPGSSVITQMLNAITFDSESALVWSLSSAPGWIALTDIGGRRSRLTITPPATTATGSVTVAIYDGVMSNTWTFSVLVSTNLLAILGLPDRLELEQDGLARNIFIRSVSQTTNTSYTWSLPDMPAWASIQTTTAEQARLTVQTTHARDEWLKVQLSVGGLTITNTMHVIVGNVAPRIVSGPESVDVSQDAKYRDVSFSGYDPNGGQTLTWSVVGDPSWAQFVWADQGEALLRLTRPSQTFTSNLVVRLSDGIATDTWTFAVADDNHAPVFMLATTNITVAPGDPPASFLFEVTDQDVGDTLTWSLSKSLIWFGIQSMTNGQATVVLSPPESSALENVTLFVTDGHATNSLSIVLSVTNSLPVIGGDVNNQQFSIFSGEKLLFYTATDQDQHQQVDLTVTNSATWFTWYRIAPNSVCVIVDTATGNSGSLFLRSSDGYATVSCSVPVVIQALLPTNSEPRIVGMPSSLNLSRFSPFHQYPLTVVDADANDWISWLLSTPNSNIRLDITGLRSAILTVTPSVEMSATDIVVRVSDGKATTNASFTMSVGPENLPGYMLSGGEYFFDTEPANGEGSPLYIEEGETLNDTASFGALSIIVTESLQTGHHRVGVRLRTKNNRWGSTVWSDIYVYEDSNMTVSAIAPVLSDARYSVSSDMSAGVDRSLPPAGQYDSQIEDALTETLDSAPRKPGAYRTLTGFQRSDGIWGSNVLSTFIVYDDMPVIKPPTKRIVGAEYFWDAPPSPGFGYPLDLVTETNSQGYVVQVNSSNLSSGQAIPGFHTIGVRFQDETKSWGNPVFYTVQVDLETNSLNLIDLHMESNIGDPELQYDSQHPSNTFVRLSVPEVYYYNNRWWAISGWIGVGDVPGYGSSNKVAFTLTKASDITWIWVEDVEVYSYSEYGEVQGNGNWTWYPSFKAGYGTYTVTSNATLSVTNVIPVASGEQIACTGYVGTGSAPEIGYTNTVSFTARSALSEVTWLWDRQYLLTSGANGQGRVFGNRGWYSTGNGARLTAVPDVGSSFLYWQGDATGTNPSITVTMSAPRSVSAVFVKLPTQEDYLKFEVVDPVSGNTNLVGWYADGTVLTSSYARLTHMEVGSRFVVTGWSGQGSVPAAGFTNYLSFTIHSNSVCRWQGVRQYYVSATVIPSDLGSLAVSGTITHPGAGWFDQGLVTIANTAAVGAHFLKYDLDLKGADARVEWNLDSPLDLVCLFRRDQVIGDMIAVDGGALSSTNQDVEGFTPFVDQFSMKQTEVTHTEFATYLNEALAYRTLEAAGTTSVKGRPSVRPNVKGLYATFCENNVTNGSPVSARCLTTVINASSLMDTATFSPALGMNLTNGFSGTLSGQIYIPTDSNVQMRVSGTATVMLEMNGAKVFTNATGTVTTIVRPGYGWADIQVVIMNAGTNPVFALEWQCPTNGGFTNVSGIFLRHESRTANSQVRLASTSIGTDIILTPTNVTADALTVSPSSGANYVFGTMNELFVMEASVGTPASGKAGLMIRSSNRNDSPYLLLAVNSSWQVLCEYRATPGGGVITRTCTFFTAKNPQSLRLTRIGNRFHAEVLSGGVWLDAVTQSAEEQWIEIDTSEIRTFMVGFHADAASTVFSGYRFGMPNEDNHYDGMELADLDAESARIGLGTTNYTVQAGFSSLPAVEVSWFGAKNYALWLRETTSDAGYDLPTEWQFEYAASGGDSTTVEGAYSWPRGVSPENYANLLGRTGADTYSNAAPVGSLSAYRGLNDLGGNAWEWTESLHWVNGVWHTIRGGSWNQPQAYAANSYRGYYGLPYFSNGEVGFRVVRNVLPRNEFVLVPGGSWQGANSSAYGFESNISEFYIKAMEVTVGEYAAFLNWAKANNHVQIEAGAVVGLDGQAGQVLAIVTNNPYLKYDVSSSRFSVISNSVQRPMIMVSWYGAKAYAEYLDLFDDVYTYGLPTEWEWEKASRNGIDWDYVWQNTMTLLPDNQASLSQLQEVASMGPDTAYNAAAIPGLYDIVANAAEWTESSPFDQPGEYIIRGLSVGYPSWMQGSTYRGFYKSPIFMDKYVGFRVVARSSNLQVTTISTNIGFARNSGIFELPVVCNNPSSANPLNWFLDNAPAGLSLQTTGGDTVRLLVNTYGSFTGTAIRISVCDGTQTVFLKMNVSEISQCGSLRVTIGPEDVIRHGAKWRIPAAGDTNWLASGEAVTNLVSAQRYTIEFRPVMYWTSPSGQAADVDVDQMTVLGVNYSPNLTTLGTPEYWLVDNGIEPSNTGDAQDTDHDGQLNWMEYQAGTQPTNAKSLLWMPNIEVIGSNAVVVSWTSESNKVYVLKRTENLNNEFTNVIDEISACPPMNTFTSFVGGAKQQFFKVQLKR